MPFLRFSRDKRGYENTYLVHTQTRRGKPPRQKVLYWYRTPPGVRVGRPPFDVEVRKHLEAQNPDVTFDWDAIASTPFPPPTESEHWRERRRTERALRQALRSEESVEDLDEQVGLTPPAEDATPTAPPIETQQPEPSAAPPPTESTAPASQPSASVTAPADAQRRRRRRGGRRRRGRGRPEQISAANGALDAPAAGETQENERELPNESNESFDPAEVPESADPAEE